MSSSIPEIVGPYAHFFDPKSVDNMSDVIVHAVSGYSYLSSNALGGRLHVEKFREEVVDRVIDSFWSRLDV
jgi:hypothetical protein